MTREEILSMPAGREMDYAVAETVMGWKWWARSKEERDDPRGPRVNRVVRSLRPPDFDPAPWLEWAEKTGNVFRKADGGEPVERIQGFGDAYSSSSVPPYSKDWSAAGEVVDALRLRGIYLSLHARPSGYSAEAWGPDGERLLNLDGRGDTGPLAVSRAALLSVTP